MLKNEVSEEDLLSKKQGLISCLPEEVKDYVISDLEKAYELNYPVLQYPSKIKSLNLIKSQQYQGVLKGVKGQYLLFEDGTVFNVRNNEGLVVSLEID